MNDWKMLGLQSSFWVERERIKNGMKLVFHDQKEVYLTDWHLEMLMFIWMLMRPEMNAYQ